MAEKIKAIFIDVDDCLVPTDGVVSHQFYAGLRKVSQFIKLANEGTFPPIGWCSGRDRNYIEAVSFFLGLPNSWSVIESGIALFNPTTKEILLNPALTPATQAAFEMIRRERLPQVLKKFPDLFEYPGNMINIALERRHGVETGIEEYYRVVKAELRDLEKQNLLVIHHSRIAVDISPVGTDGIPIDKASGMEFMSRHSGIDLKQVLGIGDSKGDFPMLNLVGYTACPANASQECQELITKKGGYISSFRYASGVADIIQHLT